MLLMGYQLIAMRHQSLNPSTFSTAIVPSFTFTAIPFNFFNFTNSTGCLLQKSGQTYEYYLITVTNRQNQSITYINASMQLGSVTFLDHHYPDVTGPLVLLQAQGSSTGVTTWAFPIYFPMSGVAYGINYAGTNVMFGLFGISMFIRIGNYAEGPFLIMHPDLEASYLAPHC
jgi:hypothetical protein